MTPAKEKKLYQAVAKLSSKYGNDEKHASSVQEAALKIFDFLKANYPLSAQDRVLLSHASLLHDVGNYISSKKHNQHSKYIIENDSILGEYPQDEKKLLSLIVFNHRKKVHKDTALLSKKERDTVLKLSAILRVADSLDFSRENMKIKDPVLMNSELKIIIQGVLPERIAGRLQQKKGLFHDTFSLDVILGE